MPFTGGHGPQDIDVIDVSSWPSSSSTFGPRLRRMMMRFWSSSPPDPLIIIILLRKGKLELPSFFFLSEEVKTIPSQQWILGPKSANPSSLPRRFWTLDFTFLNAPSFWLMKDDKWVTRFGNGLAPEIMGDNSKKRK